MDCLINKKNSDNDDEIIDNNVLNTSNCQLAKAKENINTTECKKSNFLKDLINGKRRNIVHEYINKCKSINNNNTCAMDIGGTLIKLVYTSDKYVYSENENIYNEYAEIKIGVKTYLFFKFFKIYELEEALNFIIKHNIIKKKIALTGGGSCKYFYNIIEKIVYNEIIEKFKFSDGDYKLYVSNIYYCENSLTLHIEIYLNKNKGNNNESKLFNKELIDGFNCKTVKIYLSKSNNNEMYNVESKTDVTNANYKYNYNLGENKKKIKNKSEMKKKTNSNCDSNCNKDIVSSNNNIEVVNSNNNDDCENNTFNGEILLECSKRDEMQSIINGIHVLFNVTYSIVRYHLLFKTEIPVKIKHCLYPFIIANIGSGVSILKSEDYEKFQRISGTAIGGGTVMGLAQLILGKITFEELIKLAENGTSSLDLKVKHLRGDTAGSGYLNVNTLASFFGFIKHILKKKKKFHNSEFRQNVARSLILMASYHIGCLSYLLAKIHNVRRIFFSGKYISNHNFIMESLTYGVYFHYINYYSKKNELDNSVRDKIMGNIFKSKYRETESKEIKINENVDDFLPEVLFLKHDSYLGAIGCFFS